MSRVVSLYLPTWPTDRRRRQLGGTAPPPEQPLVIAGHDRARRIVMAADQAAQALGLQPGQPLSEAQALVPHLHIEPADPAADAAALDRLALWVQHRYSPIVAIDRPNGLLPDGLLIDTTGVAHLFGDETALLDDLHRRLRAAQIDGRLAVANTPGAAHALARFGTTGRDQQVEALPIAALRLDHAVAERLRRLGFTTIAELAATPRAPLALRFGAGPGRRLDQLFGRLAEPIQPIRPTGLIAVRRPCVEPISAPATLARAIARLVAALCPVLEAKGLGARRLDLMFHRVDDQVQAIRIGTAKPVRDPKRLTRLLTDRLESVDPGFGIDLMTLTCVLSEPLAWRQDDALGHTAETNLADLVDLLANRIGADRLYRATPVESDLPERTVRRLVPLAPATHATWPTHWPRPTRLLSPPEPVDTMALLPDQPPVQFTWRGLRRRIKRADGPERVFGEWWHAEAETAAIRDYFMVEDESGERFWLYRAGDGQDPATGDLRWYLHGVFA